MLLGASGRGKSRPASLAPECQANLSRVAPKSVPYQSQEFERLEDVHINLRTDYALRAVLEIASRSDRLALVTRDDISEHQDIPRRYLATILNELRRAGLVSATRGAEGGYRLAKPANSITLADVIRAVDGPLTQVGGVRPENLKYRGSATKLGLVWVELRAAERQILESTTLQDLLVAPGK